MERVRLHVVIRGTVQGVFFRANTRDKARSLNLTGWVRNCHDGSVEAVFEGEKDNVERILKWCGKGPPGARVRSLEADSELVTGEFAAFAIRY